MIIDGKKCAQKLLDDLKKKTQKLNKKPAIAVILAGDNPASEIYVNSKEKTAAELGFKSYVYKFDKNVTQDEISKLIKNLNKNSEINAILVQLPLFSHLNSDEITELIDPKKDVDGFHPLNIGKLASNTKPYALCCTPKGIIKLLKEYNVNLKGADVVVIGRSNIVGRPLSQLLINEDSTVTLAHSKTKNLKTITKNADIVISATGQTDLIKKDMIKKGAVVVDVGITRKENGKIAGDVDFNNIKDIASLITPVPGGVGPMTIACLMENTYELFLEQNKAE